MSSPIQIAPAPPDSENDQHPAPRKLPTLHAFFSPSGLLFQPPLAFEHRARHYKMATLLNAL